MAQQFYFSLTRMVPVPHPFFPCMWSIVQIKSYFELELKSLSALVKLHLKFYSLDAKGNFNKYFYCHVESKANRVRGS